MPCFQHPRKAFGLPDFVRVDTFYSARPTRLSLVLDTRLLRLSRPFPECGHSDPASCIRLLLVGPPLSKLSVYGKLIHTPAFVQAHQSQLTDLVVLIVSVEDVEGIAIRNLDDLAGEGIGEGYGSRQQQECA